MKRSMIAVVSVVAVLLLAAGGASAVPITYLIGHPHSQGISTTNSVSFTSGTSWTSPFLGRFIMDPVNDDLPAIYPIYTIPNLGASPHSHNGFFSYCLEPLVSIGVGETVSYSFSIVPLAPMDGIDAGDAALIRELLGRYSPLLQNDPTGPYTGGTFRTAAAALQLAMWKITMDRATETLGSWDFTSGLMRVNSNNVPQETIPASIKADAVALLMLNSLTGSGPMAYGLEGLESTQTQDLIIQPEPATMALMALGAVGLLVRRKRSK